MAHEWLASTPCSWPLGLWPHPPKDLFLRPIDGRSEQEAMSFSSFLRRFAGRRARRSLKPASRRWRPLVEVLEDRAVPATITVNSIGDGAFRDAFLTLREAISLANGELAYTDLKPEEKALVNGGQPAKFQF